MGHPKLSIEDNTSIVIRKSGYIDDRTVAIYSNKASRDISRRLVNSLIEGDDLLVILSTGKNILEALSQAIQAVREYSMSLDKLINKLAGRPGFEPGTYGSLQG